MRSEHSRQKTNALEDSQNQKRRVRYGDWQTEGNPFPAVDLTLSIKEINIPKVHTEEDSFIFVCIYAAGDEGDGEQVDEQKSNRGGGNGPN
jgi:hypothetical protein